MSSFFDATKSQFVVPGYQTGSYEILLLSTKTGTESNYQFDINNFDPYFYISASDFSVQYSRAADVDVRLAGEGPTPTTFNIKPYEIKFSFSMPLRVESNGYLNMTFDLLFNMFMYGYQGNKTKILSYFKAENLDLPISAGTSNIAIKDISDFLAFNLPFTADIHTEGESPARQTVSVTAVNKSTKTITISPGLNASRTPRYSYVEIPNYLNTAAYFPYSFSILSHREGLFTDCLIDKISFTITPKDNVVAKFECVALNLLSQYQVDVRNNFNSILSNLKKQRPHHLLTGANFRYTPIQLAGTMGDYGLGSSSKDDLMQGFQGLDLSNFMINEINLNLSNNLKPSHTLHSSHSDDEIRFNKVMKPYAYYSEGRSIESDIKYTSPIDPYLLASKLPGPNGINNGGVSYNFDKFYINFDQVVYSPGDTNSSMDENVTKSVKWQSITGNLNYSPVLKPN